AADARGGIGAGRGHGGLGDGRAPDPPAIPQDEALGQSRQPGEAARLANPPVAVAGGGQGAQPSGSSGSKRVAARMLSPSKPRRASRSAALRRWARST